MVRINFTKSCITLLHHIPVPFQTDTKAADLHQKYVVVATSSRFLKAGTKLNRLVESKLPR